MTIEMDRAQLSEARVDALCREESARRAQRGELGVVFEPFFADMPAQAKDGFSDVANGDSDDTPRYARRLIGFVIWREGLLDRALAHIRVATSCGGRDYADTFDHDLARARTAIQLAKSIPAPTDALKLGGRSRSRRKAFGVAISADDAAANADAKLPIAAWNPSSLAY
ncbi:hypothetical protein LA345_13290 [Burkholderia vietnamiensis]|nr:hypothetical protein [Burkholderia vietnamiensis]